VLKRRIWLPQQVGVPFGQKDKKREGEANEY
jgi:hypothetical protein